MSIDSERRTGRVFDSEKKKLLLDERVRDTVKVDEYQTFREKFR